MRVVHSVDELEALLAAFAAREPVAVPLPRPAREEVSITRRAEDSEPPAADAVERRGANVRGLSSEYAVAHGAAECLDIEILSGVCFLFAEHKQTAARLLREANARIPNAAPVPVKSTSGGAIVWRPGATNARRLYETNGAGVGLRLPPGSLKNWSCRWVASDWSFALSLAAAAATCCDPMRRDTSDLMVYYASGILFDPERKLKAPGRWSRSPMLALTPEDFGFAPVRYYSQAGFVAEELPGPGRGPGSGIRVRIFVVSVTSCFEFRQDLSGTGSGRFVGGSRDGLGSAQTAGCRFGRARKSEQLSLAAVLGKPEEDESADDKSADDKSADDKLEGCIPEGDKSVDGKPEGDKPADDKLEGGEKTYPDADKEAQAPSSAARTRTPLGSTEVTHCENCGSPLEEVAWTPVSLGARREPWTPVLCRWCAPPMCGVAPVRVARPGQKEAAARVFGAAEGVVVAPGACLVEIPSRRDGGALDSGEPGAKVLVLARQVYGEPPGAEMRFRELLPRAAADVGPVSAAIVVDKFFLCRSGGEGERHAMRRLKPHDRASPLPSSRLEVFDPEPPLEVCLGHGYPPVRVDTQRIWFWVTRL